MKESVESRSANPDRCYHAASSPAGPSWTETSGDGGLNKLEEFFLDVLIYLWLKHVLEDQETQRLQTKVRRKRADQTQEGTSPK